MEHKEYKNSSLGKLDTMYVCGIIIMMIMSVMQVMYVRMYNTQ